MWAIIFLVLAICLKNSTAFATVSYRAAGGATMVRKSGCCHSLSNPLKMSNIDGPFKTIDQLRDTLPADDKCRVRLHVKGQSVASAVFRAELKKELTFYYRCGAKFTTPCDGNADEATITAEGKSSGLKRFLGIWLKGVCSPMEGRKPNFQGPPLVVEVLAGSWEAYTGEYQAGTFNTGADEPLLLTKTAGEIEGMKEASSMIGSDDSV